MNSIKLEELAQATNILGANNVSSEEIFDYVRVVSISNNKYEDEIENTLYFPTYSTHEEVKDGWYTKPFDSRPYIENIMKKYPKATIVIEPDMVDLVPKNGKFIIVPNIRKAIDDLFNYTKSKSKATTIAITGSVGKTTCAGLIESVLKQKYKVLRIYSKRITPVLLEAYIINFLNEDYDYIVLENSIYYHDHVKILADMLKPKIAGILNIESSHLGVELLDSLDSICKYKSEIFRHAKKGFVNGDDERLKSLYTDDGYLCYNEEPILKTPELELEQIDLDRITIEDDSFVFDESLKVKPFMLSKLSKVQYGMAYKIAKTLGLTPNEIKTGMGSYEPVENRLQTETAFGKKIIFDGDITTYERMKELSDNMYENQYLVLRKVGSAENTFRIKDIKDHFKKFKKVFIFDDVEYLDELKDEENVEIVSNHDFMKELDGIIIYHYSGFYRSFNCFNEENISTYDTEKYKIIK